MIIGLDEVGRGCWAGPLVAGAAALPEGFAVPMSADAGWRLDDSKKLSVRQRERAAYELEQANVPYGLGWVTAQELDVVGMTQAVKLAMTRAYQALPAVVRHQASDIIIDGSINYLSDVVGISGSRAVVKADGSIPAVSVASIMAKVARDRYMQEADIEYPGYGFAKHVGYGTSIHRAALAANGPCALHRRSFKPIAALLT